LLVVWSRQKSSDFPNGKPLLAVLNMLENVSDRERDFRFRSAETKLGQLLANIGLIVFAQIVKIILLQH
jgi:hypothetical protein